MGRTRSLALGACLALALAALAGTAWAASPGCATQPANGTVVFLPSPGSVRVADLQAARLIADANAMFRRIDAEMSAMESQMNALAALPIELPTPPQVIQAGFGGAPWIGTVPGNGVVFTSISSGSGTCSETITYSYPAPGGRPIVNVSQHGNTCGAVSVNRPARVQAAQPVPPQVTVPASSRSRLWQATYRRPAAWPRG